MMKFRTLLVVLLLAVIALPDGVTVCLRKLGGESVARGCCASCCTRKVPSRSQPAATADHCPHCCLTTPASARSLVPSTKKPLSGELAAPLALSFFRVDQRPAFLQLAPRSDHGRAPPCGSRSLPLRI
jgi:hypothetical protein